MFQRKCSHSPALPLSDFSSDWPSGKKEKKKQTNEQKQKQRFCIDYLKLQLKSGLQSKEG